VDWLKRKWAELGATRIFPIRFPDQDVPKIAEGLFDRFVAGSTPTLSKRDIEPLARELKLVQDRAPTAAQELFARLEPPANALLEIKFHVFPLVEINPLPGMNFPGTRRRNLPLTSNRTD